MAKKVPQDIAFKLAQKAKDADKKIKAAEKKAQEAEKKAKDADRKIKAAEKKAKEAQKKAEEAAEKSEEVAEVLDDDFDDIDFDELDDFDDFDDFEEDTKDEEIEEDSQSEKDPGSVGEAEVETQGSADDDDLDALLKQASASEGSDVKVARANKLAEEGDFSGALDIWKELTASEGSDPSNWRGLASVLESRNDQGDADKARTAREHADRIETQAIAEATGRKMEDIIADLLDDGVLNFSAGSDAKDSE